MADDQADLDTLTWLQQLEPSVPWKKPQVTVKARWVQDAEPDPDTDDQYEWIRHLT